MTLHLPYVSVPVLSIIIVSIWLIASKVSPVFIITPLWEATPIPLTTTIGVAITNAQGHATTITVSPF